MGTTREGDDRRFAIIKAGLDLWRKGGESAVTARGIGKMMNLTHAGVIYHFGNSENIRHAVAEYAVSQQDLVVVPQLIVSNHPSVSTMDAATRSGYLANVALQP